MATQLVTVTAKSRVKKTIDIRRNLIKNPSFELGTDGWGMDGDFTRSNEDSYVGAYAIKHVSTADFANFNTANDANGIDVLPNTDYTVSFYYKMKVNSGLAPQFRVCRDSAFGTALAFLQMVDSGGDEFAEVELARVSVTFNTGSANKVWLRISNAGGNVEGFYDNFQLELGSETLPYFDGTLPSAKWEGSAHDSVSYIPRVYMEARARVKKNVTRTVTAKARIGELSSVQSVTAKARVKKTVLRQVSALASVYNGDTFQADSNKAIRRIAKSVMIDWKLDCNFYDETPHLMSIEIERRISEPLGGISLGMADIIFHNVDDRYTPKE